MIAPHYPVDRAGDGQWNHFQSNDRERRQYMPFPDEVRED
jgi:hypothetical protein